jgi:hypothetical protein
MAPLEGTNVPLPASVTSGPSRRTGQASQKAPSIGNDVRQFIYFDMFILISYV